MIFYERKREEICDRNEKGRRFIYLLNKNVTIVKECVTAHNMILFIVRECCYCA